VAGRGEANGAEMTIDELSRHTGITARNIRAYQTRGLLHPPRMVGRVGSYDESHVSRLNYVTRLQQRGFSLAAIRDLLTGLEAGRSLADVIGFEEALTAPWSDEAPERFTAADLDALFGGLDDSTLQRAVEVGLLVPEGDAFEAPVPRLLRVGAELLAAGIPLDAALDEYVQLAQDMERIARRLVSLFERHVWEPFVAAGLPAERLPEVTEALKRVRPTAFAAVQAVLAQEMEQAVSDSAAKQAARFLPPDQSTG
jgi:DNA-binding transcriptional MerR regulator